MEPAAAEELIHRYAPAGDFAARQAANRRALGVDYLKYVFEVSAPEHAVSLPLASFLLTLCETAEPAAAADLGSGFSSFVLRRYAGAAPGRRVVSADDDPDWLAKTSGFLASSGLPTDGLVEWSDFAAADETFDLVLYDLGHWRRRFDALPRALAALAPGGVIVLDDLHVERYREHVVDVLRSAGLRAYDLAPYTADELGRIAWAAGAP